jgi:hypothetical protein
MRTAVSFFRTLRPPAPEDRHDAGLIKMHVN